MKQVLLSLKRAVELRLPHVHRPVPKILADALFVTLAGIITGAFRELCLTNPPMSWHDCIHSRLVASVYDFVFAPFYGSIRDYFVQKVPSLRHVLVKRFLQSLSATAVFIVFWGILYAINITYIAQVHDIPDALWSFFIVAATTVWLYDYLFEKNRVLISRAAALLKSLFKRP